MKICRRDAPRAAAGEKDAPSTRGPGSLGNQRGCLPGSQLGHPPPAASPAAPAPALGEELELHYATLSFQGRKLGEPPAPETTSTEYAEIKIRT